jgi:hypothetical protein
MPNLVQPNVMAVFSRTDALFIHTCCVIPYVLNITATPPARNQSAQAAKLGN